MKAHFLIIYAVLLLLSCDSKKSPDQSQTDTLEEAKISPNSSDLLGAWQAKEPTDSGTVVTHVMTFDSSYFSEAVYVDEPALFLYTQGGSWKLENDQLLIAYEYHSMDTSKAGQTASLDIQINDELLYSSGLEWKKIDSGRPGELAGAWLITGRQRNGEMTRRTPGERKTMKILSGTRFQWIAYHTGTGKFSGTGGGTYTTENGQYTEHIEFFSRDNSRVGASLQFNYQLDSGEWHHSGLSSKGSPIYEVWTPRYMLD